MGKVIIDSNDYRIPSYDELSSAITSDTDFIDKEALIEQLKNLPDGSKICITQNGNYADSTTAYIYNKPVKVSKKENVYSLGHSDQWL